MSPISVPGKMVLKQQGVNFWTPENISTALWLDASDSSTITITSERVSQWSDKSGNNNNATVGVAEIRPKVTANAQNGLDVIEFDPPLGSYRLLLLTSQLSNIEHIFFVAKKNDVNDSSFVLMSNSNDIRGVNYGVGTGSGFAVQQLSPTLSTATRNQWHIAEIKTDGTTATLGIDGVRSSAADTDKMIVGRIGFYVNSWLEFVRQYSFRGQIAEILILYSALPDSERLRTEGYLAHKWGLTANLPTNHPYKLVPPIS